MGMVSVGQAEMIGNAKGQDLGLLWGTVYCVTTFLGLAFWCPPWWSWMPQRTSSTHSLPSFSSYSLAPFITEIFVLSPTVPQTQTTKPQSFSATSPFPLPGLPLFPLVLHNSAISLIIPRAIFDHKMAKVDCIECWFM